MSTTTSTSTVKPIIRAAEAKDVSTILALIRELAVYEKAPDSVLADESLLLKNLGLSESGPSETTARAVLLFEGEKPAGLAVYFYNFSTWTGKPGIYLEDLFVRPEFRKKGYGTALIAALAKKTLEIDGGRLDWQVLDWNEPSIKFYESLGAKPQNEWVKMRVEDDSLKKLSGLGPNVDITKM